MSFFCHSSDKALSEMIFQSNTAKSKPYKNLKFHYHQKNLIFMSLSWHLVQCNLNICNFLCHWHENDSNKDL